MFQQDLELLLDVTEEVVLEPAEVSAAPEQWKRIGEACRYLINQWELLVRYLDHGVAEIDNNLTENAIRPSAIGKKNWLFIGSPEAGETCAIIYTIIETCRRHNIEPAAYLRDVLQRIPATTNQEIHKLVPKLWKQQQEQARKVVAPRTKTQRR
jgi:hypothetical protein